jgi:hypothetical protein
MSFVAVAIGGATLIGGITSAAIGANAAGDAAGEQEQASQNALNFQEQEWGQQQQNEAPYLQAGDSALSTLQSDMPQLTKGFDPTAAGLPSTFSYNAQDFTQDPGYAFAVSQGDKAIENSAAARGGDVSGGTLKSLDSYNVGMADQDYGNAYNRAQSTYQQNYSNAENTFYNNENNTYSKLAAVAQGGANAAGTLGQEGEQAATNSGNIAIGAGNAAAAGTVGAANAVNSGISGATTSLTNTALLNQLLNGGSLTSLSSGSGYGVGQQMSAGQGLSTNIQPVSPAQWSTYNMGSTPAGTIDAYGNTIQ